MRKTPKPSLCDSCINAGIVEGGYASMSSIDGGEEFDCPQRYCAIWHIPIHFGGMNECNGYRRIQGLKGKTGRPMTDDEKTLAAHLRRWAGFDDEP